MYRKVVCEYRAQKADPKQTRITIYGNQICYSRGVSMPTGSLELVKIIITSVFSRCNA